MELFDLNPAQHKDLAIRAADAADQLTVVRDTLAKTHPSSNMFAALDKTIKSLKDAATEGKGLADLHLPALRKLHGLSSAVPVDPTSISRGVWSEQRRLKQANQQGNLQRPFKTLWSLPGIIRNNHRQSDAEALDLAIQLNPELQQKLLKMANAEREKMVARGICDTCQVHPDLQPLKRMIDLVAGYSRDIQSKCASSNDEPEELIRWRIEIFEQRLKRATCVTELTR